MSLNSDRGMAALGEVNETKRFTNNPNSLTVSDHGASTKMEWQPIETAPKDETVLVYGLWAGEINGPDTQPGLYIAKFSGRSDYEGFWWTCQDTDAYAAWVKPTYWMPLPEPPTVG